MGREGRWVNGMGWQGDSRCWLGALVQMVADGVFTFAGVAVRSLQSYLTPGSWTAGQSHSHLRLPFQRGGVNGRRTPDMLRGIGVVSEKQCQLLMGWYEQ